MVLRKNTVLVQFLNVGQEYISVNNKNPIRSDYCNKRMPLRIKKYAWFVTPEQRKKLSLGNLVKIEPRIKGRSSHAMIVANITKQHADTKFKQLHAIKIITDPIKYVSKKYRSRLFTHKLVQFMKNNLNNE